ncbi:MAG: sulfurtransferase TusA family protein [Nitrospirota bacterium]|nr:sulfurtransferase TusA family protein [Nitrospirota bacterium]
MTNEITVARELDCRGLSCPLPIIKTKREIDALQPGQVLKMIATDPGSVNDMAAWVSKTGHAMVGSEADGGTYTYYIRKVG